MTTAATRDRARNVAALLARLARTIERDREEHLRPWGLTRPQAAVLHLLDPDGEGTPIVALATAMGCHSSNLTGVLDRLESRGAIVRAARSTDRRVRAVRLTADGAALRATVDEPDAGVPGPLAGLGPDDLARLERLLAKALAGAVEDVGIPA